jgi:zinc transporter
VNVGGVPGATSPIAFWVLCAVLVLMGGMQVWLFRKIGLRHRGN